MTPGGGGRRTRLLARSSVIRFRFASNQLTCAPRIKGLKGQRIGARTQRGAWAGKVCVWFVRGGEGGASDWYVGCETCPISTGEGRDVSN